MTEKLLQYLWNHKVFRHFDFKDIEGNPVDIISFGTWNSDSGPDFLNAKIKFGNITLAGHVELHIKSSDWIFHQHSQDPNYKNIILHAVLHHDTDIQELRNNNIPTLELKNYIDDEIVRKYSQQLNGKQFIACENILSAKDIPVNFHDENILKKLQKKAEEAEVSLERYKNNFEAILFHNLAYSFGLKVNAAVFRTIAESVDFSVIQKIRQNRMQMEALLFGIAGWLDRPKDEMMHTWRREFDFLKVKFKIPEIVFRPKFLRLRPPNFPTIRLSQLASLYGQQNLFSKLIFTDQVNPIYDLLSSVKASDYWDTQFNFAKPTEITYPKTLSDEFINLIILNTILPLKYIYNRYHHEETADQILTLYHQLPAENNSVIEQWKKLGVPVHTALESQSLIFHYKNYCEEKNCLNCSIGFKLLKGL
ncbi:MULTISPECIES: DUF2851 family protein [Chryseobacterium]|uniref:DUF2851 family protein n=1 Tax=Chryseobacterium camelliae TaxID=1265445 RepID=A0ABU0TNS5_9FLAO|nr:MULTISPECIES: DUF2851 family protein [Chryseobacterium]MDT3407451.1 hypothetical protein [Pseudacidovorax intermedius]MDQ1098698.1 hypothetical protein [Chryseobacterium camelliae]MDQ1102625.1 hypothetical protein [Chryseobacterium sp. SORGH_AS_1048]MDR6086054.1 hypothetical protein [Chryseobacterium sp. SORGH_AS_0909]MDR6130422.1 hypothetical protein [Chryseobacterium sp. SORGH_AS_1175]